MFRLIFSSELAIYFFLNFKNIFALSGVLKSVVRFEKNVVFKLLSYT